jgi:hypothetical protein
MAERILENLGAREFGALPDNDTSPEAPTEGRNSKQSKEAGQKFLRY